MSRYPTALFCAICTLVLGACGSADNVGPGIRGLRPARIQIISGDHQSANSQEVLPQPLLVVVTTDAGVPVPGITIDWTIIAGDGVVSPERTITNTTGEASV